MGGSTFTNEKPAEADAAPKFTTYQRTETVEIRPYVEGELLADALRVEAFKPGDMIGRDPSTPYKQFRISEAEFETIYKTRFTVIAEPAAPAESAQ